ncbi:MAG TPA: winged helix-turn-helix domain-containing protein [Nitrososphaeraceae archaeon]|nr:winged helix-turn-helix domain-containing protein [Nitrososphaeraceae archaeon]
MNSSNRSKHEIFSDILRAIDNDETTMNEIMFKTYISYFLLKKYLTFLIQQGLIGYRKEEKRFRITQKGFHVIDVYTKMDELLVRKTRHKRPEYFVSFP